MYFKGGVAVAFETLPLLRYGQESVGEARYLKRLARHVHAHLHVTGESPQGADARDG